MDMKILVNVKYVFLAISLIASLVLVSCVVVRVPSGTGAGQALAITSLTPAQSQTFPAGAVYIQSSVNNPGKDVLTPGRPLPKMVTMILR
jgi:hypothetical protein